MSFTLIPFFSYQFSLEVTGQNAHLHRIDMY